MHVEPSHEGKHVAHDSSAETEPEERVSHLRMAGFEAVDCPLLIIARALLDAERVDAAVVHRFDPILIENPS